MSVQTFYSGALFICQLQKWIKIFMENYSLNNIMAHINRIDVHEKMVQNQDVSLFIYISLCYFFNRRLKMMGYIIFIHIIYVYSIHV